MLDRLWTSKREPLAKIATELFKHVRIGDRLDPLSHDFHSKRFGELQDIEDNS